MLHIDIWADFACPACYLAKPRIDQAIAASGHADAITVTYRSFELFPDAGSEPFDSFEHVLHKTGGDQAQAARIEEHMAALARAQGQPVVSPMGPARDIRDGKGTSGIGTYKTLYQQGL